MSLRGLLEILHESHETLDGHHHLPEHRAERSIQEMEFERYMCKAENQTAIVLTALQVPTLP